MKNNNLKNGKFDNQQPNVKCQMSNVSEKGFSLIELVVVMAIFIIVIGATISLFLSMVKYQRRALEEQELLNQASYAVEYMSRSIRTAVKDENGSCLGGLFAGYVYLLSHQDPVSGFYQGIQFVSEDNTCQQFFLDTDGVLKEIKDLNAPQNILSSDFEVKYNRFIINGDKTLQGVSGSNLFQPRITVALDVKTKTASQQESITQATVSQRNLNK